MVIVKLWEGLGNQLFQYAYARKLKEMGYDVLLLATDCIEDYFNDTMCQKRQIGINHFRLKVEIVCDASNIKDITTTIRDQGYRLIEQELASRYSEEYLTNMDNTYIKGWFQNIEYFQDIRNYILEDLLLDKNRLEKIMNHLLKDDRNEIVAVHIRRGDYHHYNKVLPVSYYNEAIEYIESKLEHPSYLLFSDDMQWVKNNINLLGCKGKKVYFCEDNNINYYEEPILMSMCSHLIIANSTFSWWGAWLNQNTDKIVVAPKGIFWFKGQEEIVPNTWITV